MADSDATTSLPVGVPEIVSSSGAPRGSGDEGSPTPSVWSQLEDSTTHGGHGHTHSSSSSSSSDGSINISSSGDSSSGSSGGGGGRGSSAVADADPMRFVSPMTAGILRGLDAAMGRRSAAADLASAGPVDGPPASWIRSVGHIPSATSGDVASAPAPASAPTSTTASASAPASAPARAPTTTTMMMVPAQAVGQNLLYLEAKTTEALHKAVEMLRVAQNEIQRCEGALESIRTMKTIFKDTLPPS